MIIFIDNKDYSFIFIINFSLLFFFSGIGFREVIINIVIIFNKVDFRRDTIDIIIIFNIKYPFFDIGIFNIGIFSIIIKRTSILTFYLT